MRSCEEASLPEKQRRTEEQSEAVPTQSEIAQTVITTVAAVKRIPVEGISIDSSLEALGMDSLDQINVLFELEGKFNIDIPDEQARSIKTVREIVEGVERLILSASDGN